MEDPVHEVSAVNQTVEVQLQDAQQESLAETWVELPAELIERETAMQEAEERIEEEAEVQETEKGKKKETAAYSSVEPVSG